MQRRVISKKYTDVSDMLSASIIRAMIMEAVRAYGTSIKLYKITRGNIPEENKSSYSSP
jgi:hypothetical protein